MITTDAILVFFTGPGGRPVKQRELARALGVHDAEYPVFRGLVRYLLRTGRLVRLKRGRLAPPDPLNLVVGTVATRRAAYVFVAVADRPEIKNVFIRAAKAGTALDGDRVLVRLLPQETGPSPEGEIIRILERAGRPVLGVFGKSKYMTYVRPDAPSPLHEIYVPPEQTMNAQPGQQVLVHIDDWAEPDLTPEGRVIKEIGRASGRERVCVLV
jgi:ribonuclease R